MTPAEQQEAQNRRLFNLQVRIDIRVVASLIRNAEQRGKLDTNKMSDFFRSMIEEHFLDLVQADQPIFKDVDEAVAYLLSKGFTTKQVQVQHSSIRDVFARSTSSPATMQEHLQKLPASEIEEAAARLREQLANNTPTEGE